MRPVNQPRSETTYLRSWIIKSAGEPPFTRRTHFQEALLIGRPEIFNTDLGSQFTSREYTGRLEEAGVAGSRDGRGRGWTTYSWSGCEGA